MSELHDLRLERLEEDMRDIRPTLARLQPTIVGALMEADLIRRAILTVVALALFTAASPARPAQQHLPPISCRTTAAG
jgi:hypothetical protein